jgi:hypothetical protein
MKHQKTRTFPIITDTYVSHYLLNEQYIASWSARKTVCIIIEMFCLDVKTLHGVREFGVRYDHYHKVVYIPESIHALQDGSDLPLPLHSCHLTPTLGFPTQSRAGSGYN